MDETTDKLRRGVIAASILDTPEHMEFYEAEKQLLLQCIGNTSHESTKERETLYYRYQAINDLIAHMQQCKFVADQIIEQAEQANNGPSEAEETFD